MFTLEEFKTRNGILTNQDDATIQFLIDSFTAEILTLLDVPIVLQAKTDDDLMRFKFTPAANKFVRVKAWSMTDLVVKVGCFTGGSLETKVLNIDYILEKIPNTNSAYQIYFLKEYYNSNYFVQLSGNYGLNGLPTNLIGLANYALLMALGSSKMVNSSYKSGGQNPMLTSESSDGISFSRSFQGFDTKIGQNILLGGLLSDKKIANQFLSLANYTNQFSTMT